MLNKGSRRWLLAGLTGLGGGLLLTAAPGLAQERAAKPWRPRPRPGLSAVRTTLVGADGRALPTFMHEGQTFVLGRFGRRYAIRIHNPTAQRVEAVVTVDGRDVVSGKRGDFVVNRGYLIRPGGSLLIDGFRTSLEAVRAFRFVDPSDSYSALRGTPENVGVIGVALFTERRPELLTRDGRGSRSEAAPSRKPAPRSRKDGSSNLGTEFGEARESHVREVSFERQNPRNPARLVSLRYDDAGGLRARGIRVFDESPVREVSDPEPFPDSRFAPPPPR